MSRISKLLFSLLTLLAIDFLLSKTNIPYNTENYFMGFEKFIKKAQITKGKNRIILLGGSSLGWGVSAKYLTEETGILTLNAGIHGNIPYKNFLKYLGNYIEKEKDLLVISPEYENINLKNVYLKRYRSREFCEVSLYTLDLYPLECLGYSITKIFRFHGLKNKLPDGDYLRLGFNEYGDYVYRSKEHQSINKFAEICHKVDIQIAKKEYVPFFKSLEKKGYRFLYIPNFIPKASCNQPEKLFSIDNLLTKNFGISNNKNNKIFFDEKYFYDSRYHLNQEGVKLKTNIFKDHIKKYLLTKKKI